MLRPCLLCLVAGLALTGQDPLTGETRWNAERWKLPSRGETMDLLGLQIHRTWRSGAYAGFGGWGSLRGERGGFITLGLSGGWRWPLSERLGLEAGGWFGGGGVGRASVGGGMMVRGHLGLDWDVKWAKLGAQWSKVRFPNGKIDSTQASLTASIPFHGIVGPANRAGTTLAGLSGETSTLGWRGLTFALGAQRYVPAASARTLDGHADRTAVDLPGLETRLDMGGRGTFVFLDMSAAARGKADGYMDALLGAGWAWPQDGAVRLVAKAAGGPAGGGNLDMGGGMAWKGTLGLEAELGAGVFLAADGGYLVAPGGSFKATVTRLQVGRRFDLVVTGGRKGLATDLVDFSGWSIRGGAQRMRAPQRRGTVAPEAIDLISLQVTHDLAGPLFFVGQGNFGMTGQAGGFAVGVLGLGLRSPALLGGGPRLRVHLLAGAAGGGGVDTGGGLLLQPMAGLEQDLGGGWSLQVMAGRSRAPKGILNTAVMDAGLAWRFGLPVKGWKSRPT